MPSHVKPLLLTQTQMEPGPSPAVRAHTSRSGKVSLHPAHTLFSLHENFLLVSKASQLDRNRRQNADSMGGHFAYWSKTPTSVSECLGSSPTSAAHSSDLLVCTPGGGRDSSSRWPLLLQWETQKEILAPCVSSGPAGEISRWELCAKTAF